MAKKATISKTAVELTEADRFFISKNLDLSVGELMAATGKSREVVKEFYDAQPKGVRADKSTYVTTIRGNDEESDDQQARRLGYHAKHKGRGAIVATQAASEHADENHKRR